MKLRRQKRKSSKALDGLASITKIWTDGKIGKTAGKGAAKVGKAAGKGAAKAKSLRPPSKVRKVLSSKPVRVGGAAAVVLGAGGAAFGKLRKKPEPAYTPPEPTEPVAAPPAADPPPLAIAPDPPVAAEPVAAEPVAAEPVADDPAADEPAADEPAADEPAADEPAADEPAADDPAPADPTPEEPTPAEDPAHVEQLAGEMPEVVEEPPAAEDEPAT